MLLYLSPGTYDIEAGIVINIEVFCSLSFVVDVSRRVLYGTKHCFSHFKNLGHGRNKANCHMFNATAVYLLVQNKQHPVWLAISSLIAEKNINVINMV